MAITYLQLSPPVLGLPTRNGCTGRRPRVAMVSCKHSQSTDDQGESKLTSRISRRDVLSYVSSAFFATFLVAGRAEARTSRQENKRKVMVKIEKIREKVLGPKEKNGDAGDDKDKEPVANLLIPPKFSGTPI